MLQDLSPAANAVLTHIGSIIAAVGGLGTAAFGLVDATKSMGGGVSTRGFASIAKVMATLLPEASPQKAAAADTSEPPAAPALSLQSILVSLKSNWINGMSHDDQVAIAKSLVKLRLNPSLAPSLAALTGIDAAVLSAISLKISSGDPLDKNESDAYARFDLILTTLLDQGYQRADQQYRNTAKICAACVSVLLAVTGAWVLHQLQGADGALHFFRAVLIGLVATPLAPMAKDISSAIQAGAQAVQSWKS